MSRYRIDLYREMDADGNLFWVCDHPSLPGCMSHGDSPDEALDSLVEARSLYLEALDRRGLPRPEEDGEALFYYHPIRTYA